MPHEAPLLEAQQLCRTLADGRRLLNDVSLAIHPGEQLAIVGPTGSGKTVLLRALALLDPLDSGQICWHAAPVQASEIPHYRSRVMYLPQRPALADARVETLLKVPFALHAHRNAHFDRARIVGYLEALDRDDSFLEKPQRALSGGEAQIVSLLRSLQLNPEILLLDEPTAALDTAAMRAVETLIRTWFDEAADRRAILWVSHNAAQVERVAERVLHLERGRVADGR